MEIGRSHIYSTRVYTSSGVNLTYEQKHLLKSFNDPFIPCRVVIFSLCFTLSKVVSKNDNEPLKCFHMLHLNGGGGLTSNGKWLEIVCNVA